MPTPAAATRKRRNVSRRRLAAALAASTAVLPSVFWIGIQESFITPKLVVASVIAAGCVALALSGTRLRLGRPRVIDGCVTVFGLLTILSCLQSVDRGQSFWGEQYQRQGIVATGLYVAFYAFARVAITDHRRLLVLARGIAFGGVPVAIYALGQRAGLDVLWDDIPGGRVFSTIGQTNSLGAYLAVSLTVSLGVALAAGSRSGFPWAASGLQAAALIFTESRGGYLGAAVGLVVLATLAFRQNRWGWRQVAAAAAVVGMGLAVAATTTPGLSDSSQRAWSRALSADEWTTGSIRNHLDLWQVAGHVILDHPVLGTGPDTFPLVFGDYRDDVLPPESAARLRIYRVESPHNIVVAHAAGSGVPSAVLLLVILLAPTFVVARASSGREADTFRPRVVDAGVAAGIVGGVVASLFITADFTTTLFMWLLAGALVSSGERPAARQSTSAAIAGGIARSDADAGPHSARL